jgi:hypothetical protein
MTEKERLLKEIEDSRLKLQQLEENERKSRRDNSIRQLHEYTNQEKVEFFDSLYHSAYNELVEYEKRGYENEDNEHYAWEAYIEILKKGDGFWDYWNSISSLEFSEDN